jgi:hypothetical protein
LEVLKWARDNGCPWDEETCSSAAMAGELEVLKWARDNGCLLVVEDCLYYAEEADHVEVMNWLLEIE